MFQFGLTFYQIKTFMNEKIKNCYTVIWPKLIFYEAWIWFIIKTIRSFWQKMNKFLFKKSDQIIRLSLIQMLCPVFEQSVNRMVIQLASKMVC